LSRYWALLPQRSFISSAAGQQPLGARQRRIAKLAPYWRKMPALQIDQLQRQYVHKRLLERYGLPRLSLFYM